MTSHILCDCEVLATLRFRHMGHYFIKSGDFEGISVSKILHFSQGVGQLSARAKGLHKRLIMAKVPALLYSILNGAYAMHFMTFRHIRTGSALI
jgi:hypothetical protein